MFFLLSVFALTDSFLFLLVLIVIFTSKYHLKISCQISSIGNLFDNAIEASLALPEDKRLIRIYMDMKNTQLYISFTNFTASKKQKKQNGRFQTTKGDGHGFGLIRMDTIIERLDGYINRNSEDGAFTTEILIPQK